MAHSTRLWVAVAALSLAVSGIAHAQGNTTGSLTGTLTDASGGVLPGATVTLSGPNVQGTRTDTTDAQGTYNFRNLPPGRGYRIAGVLSGFREAVQDNIQVLLGQEGSVNLTLAPAGVTEQVEVTAATPLVDVSSTSSGVNITSEPVRDAALGARLPAAHGDGSGRLARHGRSRSPLFGQPHGRRVVGAREQLHHRRTLGDRSALRHLRRQPDDELHPGSAGAHQRLPGRVRPLDRRRVQRRHEVGQQRVPRRRVQLQPQQETGRRRRRASPQQGADDVRRPDRPATTSAARSADRSCATSCGSSAPIGPDSPHHTTSARRSKTAPRSIRQAASSIATPTSTPARSRGRRAEPHVRRARLLAIRRETAGWPVHDGNTPNADPDVGASHRDGGGHNSAASTPASWRRLAARRQRRPAPAAGRHPRPATDAGPQRSRARSTRRFALFERGGFQRFQDDTASRTAFAGSSPTSSLARTICATASTSRSTTTTADTQETWYRFFGPRSRRRVWQRTSRSGTTRLAGKGSTASTAFFAQDSWRATSNVQLNLGLRYESRGSARRTTSRSAANQTPKRARLNLRMPHGRRALTSTTTGRRGLASRGIRWQRPVEDLRLLGPVLRGHSARHEHPRDQRRGLHHHAIRDPRDVEFEQLVQPERQPAGDQRTVDGAARLVAYRASRRSTRISSRSSRTS